MSNKTILFRKDSGTRYATPFVSVLAAALEAGDTTIELETGDGASLPSPSASEEFHLALGSDGSDIEPVIITARDGDTLTCEPIHKALWEVGTPVFWPVDDLSLEALVQKSQLTSLVTFGSGADADRLVIDGTVTGPHLTGPTGAAGTFNGSADATGITTWSAGMIGPGKSVSKTITVSGIGIDDYIAAISCNSDLTGFTLTGWIAAGEFTFILTNVSTVALLAPYSAEYYVWIVNNNDGAAYSPSVPVYLNPSDKSSLITLSGSGYKANLIASQTDGSWRSVRANTARSTGTHAFSGAVTAGSNYFMLGLGDATASLETFPGNSASSFAFNTNNGTGATHNNFSGASISGTAFATVVGDIIKLVWNADTGVVTYYKNGTLQTLQWSGITGTLKPMVGMFGAMTTLFDFEEW